jgi:hypothetical protein
MRIMFLPGDHHNTDDVATMDFNACFPIKKKKKKKKKCPGRLLGHRGAWLEKRFLNMNEGNEITIKWI